MGNFYEEPYEYEELDDPFEYYVDELDQSYAYGFQAPYSIWNMWEDCVHPTLRDGISSSTYLILCCLLLKFTSSLGYFPSFWIHITSASAGLYCLYHFFEDLAIYIVVFAVLGIATLFLTQKIWKKYYGYVCIVICFSFLIICELFIVDQVQWHRIRGSQMLLAMKIVSLAFDIDSSSIEFPSLLQCFGYLFCVGSVIFGPWISFSSYMGLSQKRKMDLRWLWRIAQCLFLSYFFLTVSTCWANWLFSHDYWRWIGAYRDALSFRSSHYFVSFLSEVTILLCGISTGNSWDMTVTSPTAIEVPRSLVEVVIYWNMPMHNWLKTYVFKTARPLGKFIAVLLTYAVSSLLHGLNFQLAAVLLSLGFYTYIEHVLRLKMSDTFNCCMLARKCKKECSHLYKNNHPYVVIANIAFGLIAMFHLAYLGVMFDTSSSLQEEHHPYVVMANIAFGLFSYTMMYALGYSMEHTLTKWSDLNFASHWLAFGMYIFYLII